MRLACEARVIDRNQPQQKSRLLKSIISIGYHSSNEQNSQMFLLHENLLKKAGQRYKVSVNVNKVFDRFVHEGKATISFKEPPHDLLIQCDKIQLSAFINALKIGLCGKHNFNKSQSTQSNLNGKKLPRLKETPFTLKNHVNPKVVIKNRSDLDKVPLRTVQDLTVCKPMTANFLFLTEIHLIRNQFSIADIRFGFA